VQGSVHKGRPWHVVGVFLEIVDVDDDGIKKYDPLTPPLVADKQKCIVRVRHAEEYLVRRTCASSRLFRAQHSAAPTYTS
jgi:hypothetical protein